MGGASPSVASLFCLSPPEGVSELVEIWLSPWISLASVVAEAVPG